jgi:hypothetical protein
MRQERLSLKQAANRSSVKNPESLDFLGDPRFGESSHLQESWGCGLVFLQIERGAWL